ncbi:GNAT family N-acetyltransferase [Virgibacillus oceani]|uniref:N-acetyltransferase domain-containing protein n=1 Tax=Virgibacillus oceani TaxID=1479511 RepID=A0A917HJG4_9BACI|nr:GNAT family N-acetyltransferase [Virgibacillus oceani]GGG81616.1 hypothetical protein GCM10011398_28880 [Virgibacillus oceani]
MYKLREAGYEDFSEVSRINNTKKNSHLTDTYFQLDKTSFTAIMEAENRKLYLVEKNGSIAAFLLFRIDHGSRTIFIEELSIDADFEKKGLDEHLYQKVERFAGKKGISQLFAAITTKNTGVHQFFEQKGWKREKEVYVLNMNE